MEYKNIHINFAQIAEIILYLLCFLDVPIMLVAGKDSFHREYYNYMTEGTRSKTYNTNESQEETDDLIKGEGFCVRVCVHVCEGEIGRLFMFFCVYVSTKWDRYFGRVDKSSTTLTEYLC